MLIYSKNKSTENSLILYVGMSKINLMEVLNLDSIILYHCNQSIYLSKKGLGVQT